MTSSGVAGGAPDTVPRGVDDLTPEWLTAAYLMVIGGMWFTVSPWRMRDLFTWGTADEKRFKILCGVRIGFGILLLVLGLFEFK